MKTEESAMKINKPNEIKCNRSDENYRKYQMNPNSCTLTKY